MPLFSYPRLAQLFKLISHENLSQTQLANYLAVSTRTVRTDVASLNDSLKKYGAVIQYQRLYGYQLLIFDTNLYANLPEQDLENEIPRTSKARIEALLVLLFASPLQDHKTMQANLALQDNNHLQEIN
ncbi:hypothetical protein AwWohl_02260 [Gammaproteobacteria bacterium]|nr:hypothetical protein AwWohl_02260 [Gammaproteobacteria bacterium]